MRILITGITGFVGRHLARYLIKEDKNEILGLGLRVKDFDIGSPSGQIEVLGVDIKDREDIENVIEKFKPQQIYHLAAQSSVSYSWENPIETFNINVFGGINILESLKKYCPTCKTLIVCTAEEYGESEIKDEAISEDFKIYPSNPYAISKSALDFFSTTYHRAYNLPIFVSRSFNHIGPGQSERFVCSDFAKQIAIMEKDRSSSTLKVGNIEAIRDFLDVRDVVKAYNYIVNRGKVGEVYNVCSGKKYKISELLKILISLSSRDDIRVEIDKNRFRPVDIDIMYGDNSKLRSHTGWEPEYKIETSLRDTLDYWRNIVNTKIARDKEKEERN